MSSLTCLRHSISAVVLLALVAALVCAAPALLRPERASAQGVTCGGVFYPSGELCGNTGSVGVTCDGVYYPTETSCPSSLGVTCGGVFYPSGEMCGNTGSVGVTCGGVYYSTEMSCPTSTGYQSCPDGSLVPTGQSCPPATITCPNGSVIATGQSCPQTVPATTGTQYCNGTYVPIGTCGAGITVTYPAGWNIVGGPTGTVLTGASGSIYTLTPGTSSYVTLPAGTPLQGGSGYWTFFPSPTTVTLAATAATSTTLALPAGTFVLIGNPSNTTVSVTGYGATVLIYDPTSGAYSQTSQLNAGQGAWAASATGGQLGIGTGIAPAGGPPAPPPPLPPPPL